MSHIVINHKTTTLQQIVENLADQRRPLVIWVDRGKGVPMGASYPWLDASRKSPGKYVSSESSYTFRQTRDTDFREAAAYSLQGVGYMRIAPWVVGESAWGTHARPWLSMGGDLVIADPNAVDFEEAAAIAREAQHWVKPPHKVILCRPQQLPYFAEREVTQRA